MTRIVTMVPTPIAIGTSSLARTCLCQDACSRSSGDGQRAHKRQPSRMISLLCAVRPPARSDTPRSGRLRHRVSHRSLASRLPYKRRSSPAGSPLHSGCGPYPPRATARRVQALLSAPNGCYDRCRHGRRRVHQHGGLVVGQTRLVRDPHLAGPEPTTFWTPTGPLFGEIGTI